MSKTKTLSKSSNLFRVAFNVSLQTVNRAGRNYARFFFVLFLFDVVDFTFVSHCRESFTNLIISQMITNGSFIMAALKYTSFTARFIACP